MAAVVLATLASCTPAPHRSPANPTTTPETPSATPATAAPPNPSTDARRMAETWTRFDDTYLPIAKDRWCDLTASRSGAAELDGQVVRVSILDLRDFRLSFSDLERIHGPVMVKLSSSDLADAEFHDWVRQLVQAQDVGIDGHLGEHWRLLLEIVGDATGP
ncbi:MAG: hypothetical protein AAF721_34745, partial [Myxococcota bacterium]